MVEQQIALATPDGKMPTFVVHPERGGPFPVVLVLMDGLGMREALRDVARRLATTGYYVMLPDLYYRAGERAPFRLDDPEDRERMMSLVRSLSDEMVIGDAGAALEHARSDPAGRPGVAGVMGFCMGGRFSIVVAQGLGSQIAAGAAIHPGISGDLPADQISAELYLAIADKDDYCTPEQVARVEKALVEHGVTHEIEWHRGALHGFGVAGGELYHKEASERVWERLQALFARRLR